MSTSLFAQDGQTTKKPERSRVIITKNKLVATPTPPRRKIVIIPSPGPGRVATPKPTPKVVVTPPGKTVPGQSPLPIDKQSGPLRYSDLQSKIEEAKRYMRIKPLRISLNDTTQTTSIVRLAFFDRNIRKIDYAVVSKPLFLKKDTSNLVRTENNKTVRIYTIRGNGVNTPVMIFDLYNRPHIPLIVQYPIERYGKFREMAYYVSSHPEVVTPETVNAGRIYVRNVLDVARQKLKAKRISIQPKIVDIAERLALIEHVDHYRFRTEYHPRIYNDIYMLYALNKGQTYRYSVSSAGAGGMVQMIPATYRMIRSRYYQVGLIPDFVKGMRNHTNAAQAMLLYMQMTWDDLISKKTIRDALASGIATEEQLIAAGYNSNPTRLPRYIRRGGAGWTRLIPRETKVYLRIFESVERHVPLRRRTR